MRACAAGTRGPQGGGPLDPRALEPQDYRDRLKERGCRDLRLVCLLAAPEGIAKMRELVDPIGVPTTLVVAAVDERLNEHGYIVPGLGDAGDRLYGLAQ